jgi:hypothetical protein
MLIMAASTGDTPLGHSTGAYSHDSNPGYSNPDWLSRVKGCLPLSALSLPGTHDTMSFHGGDAVQTQTMTLATQLDSGIRVTWRCSTGARRRLPAHR